MKTRMVIAKDMMAQIRPALGIAWLLKEIPLLYSIERLRTDGFQVGVEYIRLLDLLILLAAQVSLVLPFGNFNTIYKILCAP